MLGNAAPHALLNTAQMAQADASAVAHGTSVGTLMQNAGQAVAHAIQQTWSARPTLVLCGPGNNGGDGFAAARILLQAGWPVKLCLLGAIEQLKGAALEHAQAWCQTKRSSELDTDAILPCQTEIVADTHLVIDALFGAGLNRALDPLALNMLQAAQQQAIPIVAIDVPSGIMGDTGQNLGAVACAMTVTFFRKKPAHLLLPSSELCGQVLVADIGIAAEVLNAIHPNTWENHPDLWLASMPKLTAASHKYQRGHALIIGAYPMTGASRLAARAAARIGAGLTSIAVPAIAFHIYASTLTSIMLKVLDCPADFANLLQEPRYTSFLLGPGAGAQDETSRASLRQQAQSLLASKKPVVLDADALNAFAGHLPELSHAIQGDCVLTPHEGEFKRLFGADMDMQLDKLSRARMAAWLSNAVIILKGADTIIVSPDGQAIINSNAPASLATAGSGDVLAGIITGLLTQGMPAFDAAAAAVWLHAEAANIFGPGLIAEDLSEILPQVLQTLTKKLT
jgi:ADP-dependent NAD(P)H-hydrate dehydratase / NAD(P)H-hydrate epimerase